MERLFVFLLFVEAHTFIVEAERGLLARRFLLELLLGSGQLFLKLLVFGPQFFHFRIQANGIVTKLR